MNDFKQASPVARVVTAPPAVVENAVSLPVAESYVEREYVQSFDRSQELRRPELRYPSVTAPVPSSRFPPTCGCEHGLHERRRSFFGSVKGWVWSLHGKVSQTVRLIIMSEEQLAREDALEQAIVEEGSRVANAEAEILKSEDQAEREERHAAWAFIEKLPTESAMALAIQAEMERSTNYYKQLSERRAERLRQREAAREDVVKYRRQRYLSAILRTMSFTATSLFALYSLKRFLDSKQSSSNRKSTTKPSNNNNTVSKALATSSRTSPNPQSENDEKYVWYIGRKPADDQPPSRSYPEQFEGRRHQRCGWWHKSNE